eukprot:10010936-Ditylum_brightwellii.AAC.1
MVRLTLWIEWKTVKGKNIVVPNLVDLGEWCTTYGNNGRSTSRIESKNRQRSSFVDNTDEGTYGND